MRPTHLRSVTVTDPDPGALADFYEQVWGLARADEHGGTVYLRGAGPEHHILAIRPGEQATVRGYALGLADARSVDAAAEQLDADPRTAVVRGPGPIDAPGGGYGLAAVDPDGREIELSADVEPVGAPTHQPPVRPTKLSHVVLNSPNPEAYADLLIGALDFRLSDETEFMQFLKCNRDHHSVAITRAPHASLNHVAFELPTVDDMLRGVQHMEAHGYETIWGPGRHGPGNNVFGYFVAPNGQVVEYTSELLQFDDADLAPHMWVPDDYELWDDWAAPDSLRPTPEARELMLGVPEGSG